MQISCIRYFISYNSRQKKFEKKPLMKQLHTKCKSRYQRRQLVTTGVRCFKNDIWREQNNKAPAKCHQSTCEVLSVKTIFSLLLTPNRAHFAYKCSTRCWRLERKIRTMDCWNAHRRTGNLKKPNIFKTVILFTKITI